jgi:membrane protein DedA with SNARE-associated domain
MGTAFWLAFTTSLGYYFGSQLPIPQEYVGAMIGFAVGTIMLLIGSSVSSKGSGSSSSGSSSSSLSDIFDLFD